MLHHFWKSSVALRKKVGMEKNKKRVLYSCSEVKCLFHIYYDGHMSTFMRKKKHLTWTADRAVRSLSSEYCRWLIRSFILIWEKTCKDPVQKGCRRLSFQCCRSHSQASANVVHHPTALKRGARWHFTFSSTTLPTLTMACKSVFDGEHNSECRSA